MITEHHLFRLFINDQIQVPTLLHSLQACLDSSEDASALCSSVMLFVLLLEQGLQPTSLVLTFALKMMSCPKITTEKRRFLCVMLLKYTTKRYMDFLRFDQQMANLLQQLFEACRKLALGDGKIALKVRVESEELARVLSASPYALFIRPKSPQKQRSPSTSRLTPRTTVAETPSPAKHNSGLSLLGKVRKTMEEVSGELKGGNARKIREMIRKKVDEAVNFCQKVDEKGEDAIEAHLNSLLASLCQVLDMLRRSSSPSNSVISGLFASPGV